MSMILGQIKERAEEYGLTRLSQDSGVSRPQIHKILNGSSSPSLETLTKILATLGLGLRLTRGSQRQLDLTKMEALKYAMASYGAPYVLSNEAIEGLREAAIPSLKDTLIHAIKEGRYSSEINSLLPFFIHKNSAKIDLPSLTSSINDSQYYGYILDLLFRMTDDRKYLMALSHLKIQEGQLRHAPLIKGERRNRFQKAYFDRVVNPVAQSWKFSTADSFESIKQRFNKWSEGDLHS